MKKIALVLASLLLPAAMVVACSAADTLVDPNGSRCDTICDKASQCINADQSKCSANCKDQASKNSTFADSLEACSNCLSNATCPDAAKCGNGCLSTIATSTD